VTLYSNQLTVNGITINNPCSSPNSAAVEYDPRSGLLWVGGQTNLCIFKIAAANGTPNQAILVGYLGYLVHVWDVMLMSKVIFR
jgi:hypothetical protein